jgi:hypothetical protein
MMIYDVTREITYTDVLKLARDLHQIDVVRAEAAAGGTWVLKGRDILERITRTQEAQRLAVLTIIVVNTAQAVILGMLRVGSIDEGMAQRSASMLNEAIAIGPEFLH